MDKAPKPGNHSRYKWFERTLHEATRWWDRRAQVSFGYRKSLLISTRLHSRLLYRPLSEHTSSVLCHAMVSIYMYMYIHVPHEQILLKRSCMDALTRLSALLCGRIPECPTVSRMSLTHQLSTALSSAKVAVTALECAITAIDILTNPSDGIRGSRMAD